MKVSFELSKYDIIGMASFLGASSDNLENIEKYINENNVLQIDCFEEGDDGYTELKTTISVMAIAQISKDLNL